MTFGLPLRSGSSRPGFRRRLFTITIVVMVNAVMLVALHFPVAILAIGLQAIGSQLGLLRGDPNSNDGEAALATAMGGVSTATVTVAAAVALWLIFRSRNARARWAIVATCTVTVLVTLLAIASTQRA